VAIGYVVATQRTGSVAVAGELLNDFRKAHRGRLHGCWIYSNPGILPQASAAHYWPIVSLPVLATDVRL